jgi:hypothetical protein
MNDTSLFTTHEEYIESLEEPRKSQIRALHELIVETVPQLTPYIESGMLGYGKYHYKYQSGREGDSCIIGLASQKNYISIYICAQGQGLAQLYRAKLPKADIGKACIRYRKFQDIDFETLRQLFKEVATLELAI